MSALTDYERERYKRQIMMDGWGVEGQEKLKNASAMVTRIGGLGGPAALWLALGGIGKLVLAHGGELTLSNMNRQNLMSHDGVGKLRMPQAREAIVRVNPQVEIVAVAEEVNEENVENLVKQADVVLDCPPTFEERFLLNKACVALGKPMVEAAMNGSEFHLTTLVPGRTPCLACLYPDNPDWHIPFPVVGAVSGAAGCLAAMEAMKVIVGFGQPLYGRMLVMDTATMESHKFRVAREPGCPVCGHLGRD